VCGIAGIVDLRGERPIDLAALRRMAAAIVHRGPDEEGFFVDAGVGLASRRLSIVGLADGQQPMFNETGSVVVVFNGELFDYPERKAELAARGHEFRTHSDTELLVHLWEELGEGMFERLRGQYAFALFDRESRTLILARDRVGICPLHWARRGDALYFGSEIKAILASGRIEARADVRGVDHIFTFFAMATRRTAFEGVSSLLPGSYLKIQFRDDARPAAVQERIHWDLDFPDRGDEYNPPMRRAVAEFREVFFEAVDLRLRADVPVVAYLSGGVDSTSVAAAVQNIRGESAPTFTIQIASPNLDETDRALLAARTIGARPTIVRCSSEEISAAYPALVAAAEAPVMDTSCAALLCLAREVHRQGFRAAVTGEGADEALCGYPWYKTNRLLRLLDVGRFRPSNVVRRAFLKVTAPQIPWSNVERIQELIGGPHACMDIYGLVSLSRSLFYRPETYEAIGGHIAYEDLVLNLDRLARWHPLNQSLYLGYKTMLPGLLMNHKGDRPAMHSSVETRYPFLDERVVEFCSRIHPRYKLRGLTRDKHVLRLMAAEMLPGEIANRPKAMFRAPFANTFFSNPPPFVEELLSEESLRRTGYFDPARVRTYRESFGGYRWSGGRRLTIEMGLTGVMATQLWHHLFLGGGLCHLPAWTAPSVDLRRPPVVRRPAANMVGAGRDGYPNAG
jgi:asparagine synthase (glutamine-hydrolysing)